MSSQPIDTASSNCESDSVGAYAALLDRSAESVLALLQEAGVEKIHASDRLSKQERSQLLEHLQASLGIYSHPNRMLVGTGKELAIGYLKYVQVFLIGNIGRLLADESAADQHQEVHRRKAEMLKQLRKLIKQVLHSVIGPTLQERSFSAMQKRGGGRTRHASVYFHSLKVDGRNLP